MTRKTRTHVGLPDTATTEPTLQPKHLTKQAFAKRLYQLMVAKGWRQSELARQAGLPRDSVSTYIRAKTWPTPTSLKKLAEALDVKPEELLPNVIESAIDEDQPAFEMKVSPNAPDIAWLRVNRLVRTLTAVKIAELLQNDDALDGRGSGGQVQAHAANG